MLYDNARLARVHLHAYQITGDDFYCHITTEILDYVIREMTDPNGGFSSSQDADSEGHECIFFVGTPDEICSGLGGSALGLLVVAWKRDGDASVVPLLEGREAREGKATAYVCENFACRMPVTDADALETQLAMDSSNTNV